MAKLWQTLLGRNQVARYDVDQYASDLQSAFYGGQLLGGSSSWSRTEDLETPFTGYIQQIYKSNGPIFAIILSRMLLFTEGVFCWWEIGENGDIGLPAGRSGLQPLERPWPNAGTAELLARMEQDVSLGGNFYAAREGDRVRRLRPDWTTIVLNKPPAEATESDVEGYWYHPGRHFTAVDVPDQNDSFYTTDEACHWSPIPDPDALYRGMSWLQPIVQEVMADKAATMHKKKFFDNGATLGTVIAAKENLTKKQFDVWRDTILAQHQGVDRAYKPLFLASPVDVTVQGVSLNQLDFKVSQGSGETRLCAAGGVPPIIVGLSEGLASATYSNYGMARRKFGDHWARPQWRSAAFALSAVVDAPSEDVRLGVNTNGIAFLREDQKDAAEIQQIKQVTIRGYVEAGFTKASAIAAVDADDRSLLVDSGLVSVQLLPPGSAPDDGTEAPESDEEDEPEPAASRARDGHELHSYWTRGAGLARWVDDPHPFKALLGFLKRHMPETKARKTAAEWFREVKGFLPSGRPPGYEGVEEFGEMVDTTDAPPEPRRANKRTDRKARRSEDAEPDDRWVTWTQLYDHLREHVGDERAKRIAAEWFHERYGYWPGHQKGSNPTGPG